MSCIQEVYTFKHGKNLPQMILPGDNGVHCVSSNKQLFLSLCT